MAANLRRNLAAASTGKLVFFAAAFVRNLLVARVFVPADFGAWNLGLVWLQYGQWSHLTLLNAFRLDGARTRGAGDAERFDELCRLAWTASFVPAVGVALVGVAGAFAVGDPGLRAALVMLAVLIIPYQLYTFAGSYLSVNEQFVILGQMQALYAVLNLVLTLALAAWAGFGGALAAQALSYGIVLVAYRRHCPLWMRPLLRPGLILEQLRLGLPIGLNGVVYSLFVTLDRVLIGMWLGVEALGQYGLTSLARASLGLIPDAISEVVYVRASHHYGAERSPQGVLAIVVKADRALAHLIAPAIGLGIVWLPAIITWLLPQYVGGISAVQVFLFGLYFMFPNYAGVLLTVMGQAKQVLAVYIVVVVLQAGLLRGALERWGILGAAGTTALVSFGFFVLINLYGLWRAGVDIRFALRHWLICTLPAAAMGLGLVAGQWLGNAWFPAENLLARAGVGTLTVLAASLPLLAWQARGLNLRALVSSGPA